MLDLDAARELVVAGDRDLTELSGMTDPAIFADEIAGFHAQQASEKFLKAWLILQGEEYPRTLMTYEIGLLRQSKKEMAKVAGKVLERLSRGKRFGKVYEI